MLLASVYTEPSPVLSALLHPTLLTISRYIQLDQVLEVLDVCRQLVNLIVAQTELTQTMQPKEVL